MTLLEIQDLHTSYGNIQALYGISLTVAEGEIVTLIGSNGAGKTTTLKTIIGLLKPGQGQLRFRGRDMLSMNTHELVYQGLALVPEGRGVFTRLTVIENLQLGAYSRPKSDPIQQDLEQVYDLFPRLAERKAQIAGTLSGGEQQMLAIGRALMSKPDMLLMDEPSMGLAPILVEAIFDTIKKINQQGVTILLVEQNAQMAFSVAKRGYVLQSGRIVLHDDVENLRQNDMVQQAYLGIN